MFFSKFNSSKVLAAAAGLLLSTSVLSADREEIPHDQLYGVTTGALGIHKKLNPKLHTEDGCKPYAAVNDSGNYNAGLEASGASNGGCTNGSFGQAIVRGVCNDQGDCATMYVYYMPKDVGFFPVPGHRHDFEDIVIWRKNGNFVGASYSRHGEYKFHADLHMSDGRVNAAYDYNSGTHAIVSISRSDRNKGTVWPAASWKRMTPEAKATLNVDGLWGRRGAVFPARDDNFICKINDARPGGMSYRFTSADCDDNCTTKCDP